MLFNTNFNSNSVFEQSVLVSVIEQKQLPGTFFNFLTSSRNYIWLAFIASCPACEAGMVQLYRCSWATDNQTSDIRCHSFWHNPCCALHCDAPVDMVLITLKIIVVAFIASRWPSNGSTAICACRFTTCTAHLQVNNRFLDTVILKFIFVIIKTVMVRVTQHVCQLHVKRWMNGWHNSGKAGW